VAKRQYQHSTYVGKELNDRIESVSEEYDVSVAQILREGARRELQRYEQEGYDD